MPKTPMSLALNFLTRRDYSRKELAARLVQSGIGGELAEETVAECVRLGLVNDRRYAADCAEMLAARNLGSRRIRQELARRGVAEFAGEAAENQQSGESERALEAARYKLRLIPESDPGFKKRQKLYRFLLSRGFDGDLVRETAERLLSRRETDGFFN